MVTLPELYREREGGGEAEGAVSERGEAGAGAVGRASASQALIGYSSDSGGGGSGASADNVASAER